MVEYNQGVYDPKYALFYLAFYSFKTVVDARTAKQYKMWCRPPQPGVAVIYTEIAAEAECDDSEKNQETAAIETADFTTPSRRNACCLS